MQSYINLIIGDHPTTLSTVIDTGMGEGSGMSKLNNNIIARKS